MKRREKKFLPSQCSIEPSLKVCQDPPTSTQVRNFAGKSRKIEAYGKRVPSRGEESVGNHESMLACAVAATVVRIFPDVTGKIQLSRKYKTNDSGRTTQWWFIIRGEKMTLTKLEERWEGIFNQTAWKLARGVNLQNLWCQKHGARDSLGAKPNCQCNCVTIYN